MSGETLSPDTGSEQIMDIPLYLIPSVIAEQIRKKRETVAEIEVRQGAGHFFTITVKTSEARVLRLKDKLEKAHENGGESGE